MSKKVIGAVLALLILGAAAAVAYKMVYMPTEEVVVIEPDAEVPLTGVLIQFENEGFSKLIMIDMMLYVRPEFKEATEMSSARMRNQLVMSLVNKMPDLHGQKMFEMKLQEWISDFLAQHEKFNVESALITRVVVQ
ncbi:hypothetical protein [Vibrio owensii]|uniref:hypothetical protein n=1 Tax=Vibrio owensii TaxID=696485 RepID=UPI0018F265F9|nr:hypothetical protein [Vibrio owensii]